jgi:threonine dehydrogenase-like Zn-dependent dehydrogenase
MSKTSKAVTIIKPGCIELREYPVPECPKNGLILNIEMCGICGTDKHTYSGETTQYAGTSSEQTSPFPMIPGHEIVGIVDQVFPGTSDFYGNKITEGDRITICPDIICNKCFYCKHIFGYTWCENWKGYGNSFNADENPLMGGWSEKMVVLPETFVYKVPFGLEPELAVYTELMSCAFAFDKLKDFSNLASEGFLTGSSVLIQGAGPLGIVHLIMARIIGAGTIIVLDKSNYRLNAAKTFGADITINIDSFTKEEISEQIFSKTYGRGVDVAVECVGLPEALPQALDWIRRGGLYLMEGVFTDMGEIQFNPHLIVSKSLRIIGLSNHPITSYQASMDLMLRNRDNFPLNKFVTHKFPLENFNDAMNTALDGDCIKVVFEPK